MAGKILMLLFVFFTCGSLTGNAALFLPRDTTVVDTHATMKPDYEDVNVVVETDWGTSDKTENVDVFIRIEKGKRTEVVMRKSEHQECIVELVSGMVVKIIDRKSGKVLKTFRP